MSTQGIITGIVANLVLIQVDGPVAQNEICNIGLEGTKLKAEIIKINGDIAYVQVFENTAGSIEVDTDADRYLCIGIATSDDCCTSGPTSTANAHLIASAPDLYEALEELLKIVDVGSTSLPSHMMAKLNAEKALSKARGES